MSRQLITFEIGDRCLGIDIMAIREIRAWSPATPLPNVPAHVRGVVNLRGVVLPVLDLSHRLGWGATEPSARHVIIVVRIGEQLQPVPDVGQTRAAAFLDGIATIDGRLIMILGLDRITEQQPGLAEAA